MRPRNRIALALAGAVLFAGACGREKGEPRASASSPASSSPSARPSILLVTLDTTRADAIGPEAAGVETPAFNALAARGRRFRQAYAAVPETLPSHASLMTGLYPAGHGVHENARYLSADRPVLAERLRQAGYRTAAFVSAFTLAKRFGLARGFDVYDDELPEGRAERTSLETTNRALALLGQDSAQPLFLWVHYYDPHAPYAPPEPFRSRYAKNPYLGEVAAMDEQLGRLVHGFERIRGPRAVAVVGDHGEGLGEHGESQHGNLLYQATTHVPLILAGPGVDPGASDTPVSTRRIFHTILDWAGVDPVDSLRAASAREEIVLAEAMKPFLEYGWQPQVMAVAGPRKTILAGKLELYDVAADPGEARELPPSEIPRPVRVALAGYPVPSPGGQAPAANLSGEELRKLASLGYISASAPAPVRKDAPRPADMTRLFDVIEKASDFFVREEYAKAIPLLERIAAEDPGNLDAELRLASAHSALGHAKQALEAFDRASRISPDSQDVRTYLALHYARGRDWEKAVPLLERVVTDAPDRLPALEALAVVRERQGRPAEAVTLRQRIYGMRPPTPMESIRLAELAMATGQTALAIESFESARSRQSAGFVRNADLGIVYLAAGRFAEARDALDRVPPSDPDYPIALFKRAQVSVLLHEPDQAARIEAARRGADAATRKLIDSERLFQGAQR
jgi:arylsulfatase A-like enzyme/Tfp pilus assembly protein PilF